MVEIGAKLLEIRNNNGLSQAAVEQQTGLKREYLSRLENVNGKKYLGNPTVKTLKKALAPYKDYPLSRFFGELGI
jgi:transcriptional regulator with XRE-family HTH domain